MPKRNLIPYFSITLGICFSFAFNLLAGMPSELQGVRAVDAHAIGLDDGQPDGWERHDPSNILKHEGRFLLWMTEHANGSGFLLGSRIVLLSSADDIQSAYNRLKDAGVSVGDSPHCIAKNWNGCDVWMTFFEDPACNQLAFKCNVPAET